MTRKLITIFTALAATAALAVPAVADEPSQQNSKNAAKYCKALREASGKANFAAMFGGKKNAFGKCVSKNARKDQKQEKAAHENAAKQCKAERAADPAAFAAKYGTNKDGKNAYGKCVSKRAHELKAAADETDQNDVDAAKECKAERAQDSQAFAQKYGTNANRKNAFGKCVSQKSKAKDEGGAEGGGTTA
ncbi:MAG TPA: hypothetical protein VF545_10050 [Thermoleophilaceae bacterium]|jgi:hypothetical protein